MTTGHGDPDRIDPPSAAEGVCVVVIAYNDADLVGEAIGSALGQGPEVSEVIAVNDRSDDGTARVLDELARRHPRLRVIHRTENSGGCGTPRNDGLAAATAPYVMFLDSDDVLPEGAVGALLAAAGRHQAPVAVGNCVRRELPLGLDVTWQPGLYEEAGPVESPEDRPELLHDTLCVNKLYSRAFLQEHGIRFPDGRFVYEDFVFTARVMAARPRIAVIPDTVYVWHVRRNAAQVSISLDRDAVSNWQARIEAHRTAVETFRKADAKSLAAACRVKFLDYDLRMYVRELRRRGNEYRTAWWDATREYLAGFDAGEIAAAQAPARWIARVVQAAEAPRDVERLGQLASDPARLLPPYAVAGGVPVWAEDLPSAELDGVATLPVAELPVLAEARMVRSSTRDLLITVHDMYGRLSAARPHSAEIEFLLRGAEQPALTRDAELREEDGAWSVRAVIGPDSLSRSVPRQGRRGIQSWDIRLRVHLADGSSLVTSLRSLDRMQRRVVPSIRHGVLLLQSHANASGSLAFRMALGMHGALVVARARSRG
ncbi:glycosyltransferase family 2 protein [Streptomyces sp. OZ13]|uniref:glycosyltransferase family 2 protein n=1 Tax=Streptomyces sp. OZ13 TaxID=3452210 RepID=UPI003F8CCC38